MPRDQFGANQGRQATAAEGDGVAMVQISGPGEALLYPDMRIHLAICGEGGALSACVYALLVSVRYELTRPCCLPAAMFIRI
jgi:hypothetical protein